MKQSRLIKGLATIALAVCTAQISQAKTDTSGFEQRSRGGSMSSEVCQNQYHLKIETGDFKKGGTDGNVSITMTGHDGNTVHFSRVNTFMGGDVFEDGDVDDLYLCPAGAIMGRITNLKVELSNVGLKPAWDLEKITVIHPDSKQAVFRFHKSLDNSSASASCNPCVSKSEPWNAYLIKIKTSTGVGAGTDGNIFLTLTNTQGATNRYRLNSLINKNLFREGRTDTFTIWNPRSLPDISILKLENSGAFSASDWRVDTVSLTDKNSDEVTFLFDKWINSDTPEMQRNGKRLIDLENPRLQPVQNVEYKFSDTLGDLTDIPPGDAGLVQETFRYGLQRSLRMVSSKDNTFGISAKAGWRPANSDAGYTAEITASWQQKTGKTVETLAQYTQAVEESRSHPLHKDELLVLICTWTAKYETYDIEGIGGTISPVGFISEMPRCNQSVKRYPSQSKTMSFEVYNALRKGFTDQQADEIVAKLEKRGVKINKHRFDGTYVISNRYKCGGHQFCNWNLSWDRTDPHPLATVEDDGFSWDIVPIRSKPDHYRIVNKYNCPGDAACNGELSWDGRDGTHPRATVELNDPVEWRITADKRPGNEGLYLIQNTWNCPGDEWCNANLSWDTALPHPDATVEHDGFTWRIEELKP